MVLRIVSKNPARFIRKSTSRHDKYVKKVSREIESSSEKLSYKNIKVPLLVKKPWGEETLIGLYPELELWELIIQPGRQTSYHCHPKKDTLLIMINGKAQLRTESAKEILESGSFRFIKRKASHQIKCIGDTPLLLIEIENPPDKNDLVRIEDSYERKGKAYLHKSRLINREKLTEIVLQNKEKAIQYLQRQKKGTSFEINSIVDLGVARELYIPKAVLKQFGDVSISFGAVLEVFISLGNSRNMYGNIWDAIFVVISGEMTFVEFDPTEKEKEIMRQNSGSMHEFSSVEEIQKRNLKNLSIKRMKTGDIFFSPAGCAHGIFDGDDAHYLVFINKNKEFEHWSKEFWGVSSLNGTESSDKNFYSKP